MLHSNEHTYLKYLCLKYLITPERLYELRKEFGLSQHLKTELFYWNRERGYFFVPWTGRVLCIEDDKKEVM